MKTRKIEQAPRTSLSLSDSSKKPIALVAGCNLQVDLQFHVKMFVPKAYAYKYRGRIDSAPRVGRML